MKKISRLLGFQVLIMVIAGLPASSSAQTSAHKAAKTEEPPTWVELGENGAIIARQVLESGTTCPAIQIKGVANPPTVMQQRGTPPTGFHMVCEAVIPNGATSASIGSIQLPLPKATISKIVLVGDTGCKGDTTGTGMKVTPLEEPDEEEEAEAEAAPATAASGSASASSKAKSKSKKTEQDCKSKSDWPLSTVANHAAGEKPDLVIHVGDYVYVKEEDWKQWHHQFFKPAHDLLLAAPWIFVRGNHEICKLHGSGFFYLLDPRSATACANDNTPPYLVQAGGSQFAVMDSSGALCDFSPGEPGGCSQADFAAETATWKSLFAAAKGLISSGDAFLLTHRPLWGIKSPKTDSPPSGACQAAKGRELVAINSTLQAAYQQAGMTGIKMVLSGHIHNFQLVTYQQQGSGTGPLPQLVVGDSGVELSTAPPPAFQNCKLTAQNGYLDLSTFQGMEEFGFGVLKSDGSKFDLYLKKGERALKCDIASNKATCKAEALPTKK
jgi:Calcineurin-like phosphoesterase